MVLLCVISSLQGLQAQNRDSTIAMAREALAAGDYAAAELLWMRVAYFGNRDSLWETSAALAEVQFMQGRYAEALEGYDYAARLAQGDSLKNHCQLRAAAAGLQVKNYQDVRKRLEAIGPIDDTPTELRRQFYLGGAAYGLQDFVMAEAHWAGCIHHKKDTARLHALFGQRAKLEKKHPNMAILLSQIVPGLGQLAIGQPGKALNSILLVGAIATGGIYIGAVVGIADALVLFLPPFIRYYEGGAIQTGKAAKAKLEQQKAAVLDQILHLLNQNLQN